MPLACTTGVTGLHYSIAGPVDYTASTSGLHCHYSWNTLQVLPDYTASTTGLHRQYYWNTLQVLPDYTASTTGIRCKYDWTALPALLDYIAGTAALHCQYYWITPPVLLDYTATTTNGLLTKTATKVAGIVCSTESTKKASGQQPWQLLFMKILLPSTTP